MEYQDSTTISTGRSLPASPPGISTSFAGISKQNALKNALLPAVVTREAHAG